MYAKKTVEDIDVAGKRVLVRVDFNVPLADGTVTDDTRVRMALPTISYLLDHGASVVLMSHLGRPDGTGYQEEFSVAPAVRVLERLLGKPVQLVDDICGDRAQAAAAALRPGQILMIQNLRFDKREKKNDPAFAEALSKLGDIYVDDAFGAAHRAHASIAGVADYLPAVSGLLMSREVSTLSSMLADPARPFVAILGGAKVSDKIAVIDHLLDIVDVLIIGGGMCFTFLKAQGFPVGRSLMEEAWVDQAASMIEKAGKNGVQLLLPTDIVAASAFSEDAETKIVPRNEIPDDMMGLDIGPTTSALYAEAIGKARTIFWNGPMGVFEMKAFEAGTRQVASAVAHNRNAQSIIGGGDSVAAIKKFELQDQVTFISTGGGASMELVEGKTLPGVSCLLDR